MPIEACSRCDKPLQGDEAFCSGCGVALRPLPAATEVGRSSVAPGGVQSIGPQTRVAEAPEVAPDGPEEDSPLLFGRYRIVSRLGEGGMGVVYRTEDRIGRTTVAIKMLHPRLAADPDARDRLRGEVQAARGLRSQHVVAVYEYFEEGDSAGFSMEVLDGATLEQHLAGDVEGSPFAGPPTAERLPWVAELADQLGRALDAIHRTRDRAAGGGRRLVHRDVTPANVMLGPLDPDAEPTDLHATLMDFGIAHAVGGERFTVAGVAGRLGYIAPELQLPGAEPTPAADLWSFGLLLYQALTSRLAFVSINMPGPSTLVEGLPAVVDKAVFSCLEEAETRPKGAGLVARQLRKAVEEANQERRRQRETAEKQAREGEGKEAREEAERKAQAEAEQRAREEAKRKARVAAEEKAKKVAELRAQEERKRDEAERKLREELRRAGLVQIDPGRFLMGSPPDAAGRRANETLHEVRITRPYAMGRMPVTQALWTSVMEDNPSRIVGRDHPVERVSWFDAVRFCNTMSVNRGMQPAYRAQGNRVEWDRASNGFRLPTEAEWECAARAGANLRYAGSDDLGEVSWWSGNSGGGTQPVGGKKANGWGMHDMTGNVWEWCWDLYGDYPGGPVTDPEGPDAGESRVIRGGSWRVADPNVLRVAHRLGNMSSVHIYDVGFRLARFVD